jgi:hypothetical protein
LKGECMSFPFTEHQIHATLMIIHLLIKKHAC